jgi:hypothetical protein
MSMLADSLSLTYPTSTLKLQMMLMKSVVNSEPLDAQYNHCVQTFKIHMSSLNSRDCRDSQCYGPVPKSVWNVHDGFPEMVWQGFPAQTVDLALELVHAGRARHLTGAGGW